MRNIVVEGVTFEAHDALDEDWLVDLWRRIDGDWRHRREHVFEHPLPDETPAPFAGPQPLPLTDCAIVKLCRRRDRHGLWRRIRRGRAAREGCCCVRFAHAGIPTPPLLAFGEQRRRGLHELGVIATVKVDAPTAAQTVRSTGRLDVAIDAARRLAAIHSAGLTHGDALLRNFLDVRGRALPIDLPSAGRFTRLRQRNDLVRMARSVRRTLSRHDGDSPADHDADAQRVLDAYATAFDGPKPVLQALLEASLSE